MIRPESNQTPEYPSPAYALQQFRDLTAERDAWRLKATTDSLTGLPNREVVMTTLEELASTRPGEFAVGFLDIDGLKPVNDTEGHEAGNTLIRRTAEIVQASVRGGTSNDPEQPRKSDLNSRLTARWAGDEFALAFPDVREAEQIDAIGARIIENLQASGISASFGGKIHDPLESSTDVLGAVDVKMYEQKKIRRTQRQEAERQALLPEVREEISGIVGRLNELKIGVNGLYRLYGNNSR